MTIDINRRLSEDSLQELDDINTSIDTQPKTPRLKGLFSRLAGFNFKTNPDISGRKKTLQNKGVKIDKSIPTDRVLPSGEQRALNKFVIKGEKVNPQRQPFGDKIKSRIKKRLAILDQDTGEGIDFRKISFKRSTKRFGPEDIGVPIRPDNAFVFRPNNNKQSNKFLAFFKKEQKMGNFGRASQGTVQQFLPKRNLEKFNFPAEGKGPTLNQLGKFGLASNKRLMKGDILLRRVGNKGDVGDSFQIRRDFKPNERFGVAMTPNEIFQKRRTNMKRIQRVLGAAIKPLIRKKKLGRKIKKISPKVSMLLTAQNFSASAIIARFEEFMKKNPNTKIRSGVFDPIDMRILDAKVPNDSMRLQNIFGGRDKTIGFNSVTDTRKGPNLDLKRTKLELRGVEKAGGVPGLGFDEGSFEALDVATGGSDSDVIGKLLPSQKSTGILRPNTSFDITNNPNFQRK